MTEKFHAEMYDESGDLIGYTTTTGHRVPSDEALAIAHRIMQDEAEVLRRLQ